MVPMSELPGRKQGCLPKWDPNNHFMHLVWENTLNTAKNNLNSLNNKNTMEQEGTLT